MTNGERLSAAMLGVVTVGKTVQRAQLHRIRAIEVYETVLDRVADEMKATGDVSQDTVDRSGAASRDLFRVVADQEALLTAMVNAENELIGALKFIFADIERDGEADFAAGASPPTL